MAVSGRPGSTGTDTSNQDMIEKVHYLDFSFANALTALAGGAQAGTSLSNYTMNQFSTVASGNDSAQLPKAVAGRMRIVSNAAASNSMVVFPQTGEFINALTVDSGFTVAANKVAIFFCFVNGTWNSILTA